MFACGAGFLEFFSNSNNNSGISKGFVLFLTGAHGVLKRLCFCHSCCRAKMLIGLSQMLIS